MSQELVEGIVDPAEFSDFDDAVETGIREGVVHPDELGDLSDCELEFDGLDLGGQDLWDQESSRSGTSLFET
jgi:hypothetical protein